MAACRGQCFSLREDGLWNPTYHETACMPDTMTWFYCPAHRAYHCMIMSFPCVQPLCGECAVLFYEGARGTLWLNLQDIPTTKPNALDVFQERSLNYLDVSDLIEAQRKATEAVAARAASESADSEDVDNGDDIPLPADATDNVLDEIPRHDRTYQELSTTLMQHPYKQNMFLLEYCTFEGSLAFQPCAKDIDLAGAFKALQMHDYAGDHLFKVARSWACILQAREYLPRDVRWILATIYDFASEILRGPERNKKRLWKMRSWLMHWYNVADRLFAAYEINASAPEADWFLRPTALTRDNSSDYCNEDVVWGRVHTFSAAPSMSETVVRHWALSSDHSDSEETDEEREAAKSLSATTIHEWLEGQSDDGDGGDDDDDTGTSNELALIHMASYEFDLVAAVAATHIE